MKDRGNDIKSILIILLAWLLAFGLLYIAMIKFKIRSLALHNIIHMPGNILIIDDEEQLRKLLSRIISLEGFKTVEAATIKAVWKVLEKEPDMVFAM